MGSLTHFAALNNPAALACDWCQGTRVIECADGEQAPCPECGPAPDVPPARAGHAGGLDPDAFARMWAAPANGHLQLLSWLLDTTAAVARQYLGDHPVGCGCPFCSKHYADGLREDVNAVRHGCLRDAGLLASLIIERPAPAGDTFGDDLRQLADFADRMDAEYDRMASEPVTMAAAG